MTHEKWNNTFILLFSLFTIHHLFTIQYRTHTTNTTHLFKCTFPFYFLQPLSSQIVFAKKTTCFIHCWNELTRSHMRETCFHSERLCQYSLNISYAPIQNGQAISLQMATFFSLLVFYNVSVNLFWVWNIHKETYSYMNVFYIFPLILFKTLKKKVL